MFSTCSSLFTKTKNFRSIVLLLVVSLSTVLSQESGSCPPSRQTFELVTGFVFTSPDDTLEMSPGTLHLLECLAACRRNISCRAVNFETGLCVLFASSAQDKPERLASSQFPVFTIYAQRVCLQEVPCSREWSFERVPGRQLLQRSRKSVSGVTSREMCMTLCLRERDFECRSANFHAVNKECQLSDVDRHSANVAQYYVPSENGTFYLENNCVDPSMRLCEFRKLGGKILKTVDAVFQEVTSLDECRKRCLSVEFRCQSFDLGDPTNSVCRLSHLATASVVDIEDPYLDIHGASTYEISSCYNVTIQCLSREMLIYVKTTSVFNGKVYVKSRPNSCVTDVSNNMETELRMAYNDLNCDVKQPSTGLFTNDIVIQHHDMIVTNQDLGMSVQCQYDLTNRSLHHGLRLEVSNEVKTHGMKSSNVKFPNVTMRIMDRLGRDLLSAQVGDPLLLKFEIADLQTPFDFFVRELVAMDGIDSSEIMLIDALGCPTDTLILGPLSKARSEGKILQATFDAFKFPTSEIVQFKALVTPCISSCDPVDCSVSFDGVTHRVNSYGKRRRKRSAVEEDELVVMQTIHITDKFGFDRDGRRMDEFGEFPRLNINSDDGNFSTCLTMTGLVAACTLFLVAQLAILFTWAFTRYRRTRLNSPILKETSLSIDRIYSSRRGSTTSQSFGIDNPYRGDITPYDTIPSPHSQNLQRRY